MKKNYLNKLILLALTIVSFGTASADLGDRGRGRDRDFDRGRGGRDHIGFIQGPEGTWVSGGQYTVIEQKGSYLIYHCSNGSTYYGQIIGPRQITLSSLVGTLTNGGQTIHWSNGVVYNRVGDFFVDTEIE